MGRGRKPTPPPTQPWVLTTPLLQREGRDHQCHGLFQVGKSISDPVKSPVSADPTEHKDKQARSKGQGLFLMGWCSYSLMDYWIPVPSPRAAPDGLVLAEPGADPGRTTVPALPGHVGLSPSPGILCHTGPWSLWLQSAPKDIPHPIPGLPKGTGHVG